MSRYIPTLRARHMKLIRATVFSNIHLYTRHGCSFCPSRPQNFFTPYYQYIRNAAIFLSLLYRSCIVLSSFSLSSAAFCFHMLPSILLHYWPYYHYTYTDNIWNVTRNIRDNIEPSFSYFTPRALYYWYVTEIYFSIIADINIGIAIQLLFWFHSHLRHLVSYFHIFIIWFIFIFTVEHSFCDTAEEVTLLPE